MTTIDAELVQKIAHLARLEINQDEVAPLASELQKIFSYVETLTELELNDVEPLSHLQGEYNAFRDDKAEECRDQQQILHNVPDRSGNFIRVPLIIEQESH